MTVDICSLGMQSYVPEIYKGHPVFTVRLLQTKAITSHSLTKEGKAMTYLHVVSPRIRQFHWGLK